MGCANSKASAGVDEPAKADATKYPAEPPVKPVNRPPLEPRDLECVPATHSPVPCAPLQVAVPAGVAAPTLREEPVAVMEPEGEAAEPVAEGEAAEATADPMKQISEDVTRTWALVAAGPLEPVGVAFFLKIFEIAPEALRAPPARVQPAPI